MNARLHDLDTHMKQFSYPGIKLQGCTSVGERKTRLFKMAAQLDRKGVVQKFSRAYK